MSGLSIFLDDGGVMNDNSLRAPEWQRLVAEFFAPRLGGRAEQWSAANGLIVDALPWEEPARTGETYSDWYRRYQIEWLRVMAVFVGVPMPPEDEALALAVAAARHVTFNCKSAYADAAPAVRELAARGFVLNTASGEDSHELDGYLTSMGIRDAFTYLFAPDLAQTFKRDPSYYQGIFREAGLDPAACLVVDDSAQALEWAASTGALTVLVDRKGRRKRSYAGLAVDDLSQLPSLIEKVPGG